jgi:long-chain-fatty-acid--[acyl-carrier-protein] ligase
MLQFVLKKLISLRYRIDVRGAEQLKNMDPSKGTLVLPNHPARIDPCILFSLFGFKFRLRPIGREYIIRHPLVRSLAKKMGAISIPDIQVGANSFKLKAIQKAFDEISMGLKNGQSFLLYPGNRLKFEGRERIGGTSGTHALVSANPGANIVLIRTTGLWGSSFSIAAGRNSLDHCFKFAFKVLLKNLLFFAPRRKVTIEIEVNPKGFPRNGSRLEINGYLENWYNRYPLEDGKQANTEPVTQVSYSFWRKDFLPLPEKKTVQNDEIVEIPEQTKELVYGELRRILDRPNLSIEPSMTLAFDLCMDSLDISDLCAFLVQEFDVQDLDPLTLVTVQDVLRMVVNGPKSPRVFTPLSNFRWPDEEGRPETFPPMGQTIPEAMLHACAKMRSFAACGDDVVGVLSYTQLKRAVFVLAEHFKSFEEERVAVLLPASSTAFIVILALQFAKKVPVLLNWTLGPKYLQEMMEIAQAKRVLTSLRFVNHLSQVDFGPLEGQMVFLEDIRRELPWRVKLKGALLAKVPKRFLFHRINLDPHSVAVILFTSGTEAAPKCVPLTHENVLSGVRVFFPIIDPKSTDSSYSTLPPFHVYGVIATGFGPLLTGLRVAFFPDPTNYPGLAEGIERWKSTIFPTAPSLLKKFLRIVSPTQIQSMRLFCVGGERLPQDIFATIQQAKKGIELAEGYGATECGVAISAYRASHPQKGCGKLLSILEACTIDPETAALLPEGSEGEICVRGSSVFNGYLGNVKSPFIELLGKKWYRTGDLGFIDQDRTVYLRDRLKRFTKIGGEMISLGAIEDALIQELSKNGLIQPDQYSLAICTNEKMERPQVILFSSVQVDRDQVNSILKNAGFSNLAKISRVHNLEEIPLLATGKIDYRKLSKMAE